MSTDSRARLESGEVPGLADAKRAAAALAAVGVSRVVLFGSVARGEATERSDIDLFAIHDDIDYAKCRERSHELEAAAMEASGFPVDVIVTDRPEWKMRTTGVVTSMEERAVTEGVVLVDQPTNGVVDCGKKMVTPTDDYHEALYQLEKARDGLGALHHNLHPSELERIEQRLGNEIRAFDRVQVRLARSCGEAHAVVKASVKALIQLLAKPGKAAWGHDIAELCAQLVEPYRSAVVRLLAPLEPSAVTEWHNLARYWRGGIGTTPTPQLLTALARAACRVASYTVAQFPSKHPILMDIRTDIGHVRGLPGRLQPRNRRTPLRDPDTTGAYISAQPVSPIPHTGDPSRGEDHGSRSTVVGKTRSTREAACPGTLGRFSAGHSLR